MRAGEFLFELDEIGLARFRILVDATEVRFVPQPRALDIGGPFCMAKLGDGLDEYAPVLTGAGQRGQCAQRVDRIGGFRQMVENALGGSRADARQKMKDPETGYAVARVFRKAQQGQHILDMGGIEKFEPAELHERNVASREFDLERPAMRRGPKQHRLLLQQRAFLAVRQDAIDNVARLIGFVADGDELRFCGRGAVGPEILGEALAR